MKKLLYLIPILLMFIISCTPEPEIELPPSNQGLSMNDVDSNYMCFKLRGNFPGTDTPRFIVNGVELEFVSEHKLRNGSYDAWNEYFLFKYENDLGPTANGVVCDSIVRVRVSFKWLHNSIDAIEIRRGQYPDNLFEHVEHAEDSTLYKYIFVSYASNPYNGTDFYGLQRFYAPCLWND